MLVPNVGPPQMDAAKLACLLTVILHISLLVTAKPSKHSNKGCDKTIRTTRMVRSPRVTSALRGKPVHCVYRLVKYGVGDLVFELNFKAFHVSIHHNTTWCSNGYLQIVDSPLRSNISGYFCGKLQQSRTFLAETDSVTLVFHSVSYTRQTYFRVQISVLPKRLAQERHKELLLENPGEPVIGTYCDRIYVNCQGFCDVTSPGYPGFYPRNATCRYHIMFNDTANARVVLGGQYYDHFEVWGGPFSSSRCHSNYCSSKEITTQCPYDYIRIYDVTDNGTITIIQNFCGRGHLPRIISRGQAIFLEFVSSVAGTLADDGFHLSIGTESRREYLTGSEVTTDGKCRWTFDGTSTTRGHFQNLRHWYAPGTRCSYRFVGATGQKIFLHFVNFNAHRDESCRSKLTLYDADSPNGASVRGIYCGQRQPNETLLSIGEHFYVEFDSRLGSYDGSNFEYSVMYTFVDMQPSGQRLNGSICDELFSSEDGSRKGHFDFFRNRLRLRHRHLACTFKFRGRATERIRVTFMGLNFDRTRYCDGQEKLRCGLLDDAFDSMVFLDEHQKVVECLCGWVYLPYKFTSTNSYLELRLQLHNIPTLAYRDVDTYAFKGRYEFLQIGCGESHLTGQQGELTFPSIAAHLLPRHVHCRWTVEVQPHAFVLLKFMYLFLDANCSSNYLRISTPWSKQPLPDLCGDGGATAGLEIAPFFTEDVLDHSKGAYQVVLELNSTSSARLRLLWTEVVPALLHDGHSDVRVPNDRCEYLCRGGRFCISHDLVCNGVINCPATNFTWDPLDEAMSECAAAGVILQWVLLTFSSSFAVVLLVAASLIWRKKYCHERE